jgi:hypothetical protein
VDLQQQRSDSVGGLRSQTVAITVRNFRDKPQQHHIRLRLPPGLKAEPAVLEGTVEPKSRKTFKITLTADPALVPAGLQMVPMDITLDKKRNGELFDFLFQARPADEEPKP